MRAEDAEGHGAASEEADGECPYEKPMDVEGGVELCFHKLLSLLENRKVSNISGE